MICTFVFYMDGLATVVQNLIKRGIDVDYFDSKNLTPLHISAKKGHFEVAKTLLQNGAKVDCVGLNK